MLPQDAKDDAHTKQPLEKTMSTVTGNPISGVPPTDPKSPWKDAAGFVLKMQNLKKGEVIKFDLKNTSKGTNDDKNPDSCVIAPYPPDDSGPYTSNTAGEVYFQIWGSSTGDNSLTDLSVPIYAMEVNPRNVQITLASNFPASGSATYYFAFYVWYKDKVTDLTMQRDGGKTNSNIQACWVTKTQGDYNKTMTDFDNGAGTVEFPVSANL
ncbi:hypothetical protein [Trinickia soli]|nr:hypothetical protein [Trinickia soli]